MLKKNCNGCRAHWWVGNSMQTRCVLGYETKPADIIGNDAKYYGKDIQPAEECPKPRTIAAYLEETGKPAHKKTQE